MENFAKDFAADLIENFVENLPEVLAGKAADMADREQNDIAYMERALMLAGRGAGRVNPNPMVGAVLVKDGRIIGEGWHMEYGGPHAERNALASCKTDPKGATLYVTLEPCCHYGKTPPCTEAILASGIERVVVGSRDVNPLVAGKGIGFLRGHGIRVTEGVLREACEALNTVFFHYIRTKTPYVTMKYAMTMDGKTATYAGHSKWITGETARKRVHEDRSRNMAVMTGVGTVLADDPMLNCRLIEGRSPIRLICDTRLRTPLFSQIVGSARRIPAWILTCCGEKERHTPYLESGCRVLTLPERDGHVDLAAAVRALGEEGIDSIYLEGGESLNGAALAAGIVQALHCYIAPKLFGGKTAPSPMGDPGVAFPETARLLHIRGVRRYGEDILIESVLDKEGSAP